MFLPLEHPLDWRRPPLATLLLALASVLAFALLQSGDGRAQAAAQGTYYESGLAAIELPRYRDWLVHNGGDPERIEALGRTASDPQAPWPWIVEADADFRAALAAGRIVPPYDSEHARWRAARRRFEAQLNRISAWRWGFRPARAEPLTLLSHQFLHGGLLHLLGNLLFLVAVGLLLEAAVGGVLTAGLYLAGGAVGAGVFWLFSPGGLTPLIGASGAVSALTGAMALAYGMRRVRFFYTLGFWFDYVRAPALLLLPLWFGKELLNWYWHAESSNVAFTAHMGGLAAGAALMLLAKPLRPPRFREPKASSMQAEESPDRLLARAQAHARRLEIEPATALFQRVLARGGDRVAALEGLYHCQRHQPAGDDYHRAAARVFEASGVELSEMVARVFEDYRGRARPRPRLRSASIERLAERFAREGRLDWADELFAAMARRPRQFPRLSEQRDAYRRLLLQRGELARSARLKQTPVQTG